jgi:hypothetical protein
MATHFHSLNTWGALVRKGILALATTASVLVGTVGLATPAFANTVTGGALSCGPSAQVRISVQLSSSAPVALAYTRRAAAGGAIETGSVRSYSWYTGVRSIASWAASSDVNISSAGAACS